MENLSASNHEISSAITHRNLSVSFSKDGETHEILISAEVYSNQETNSVLRVSFGDPYNEQFILDSLTSEERNAIFAFAEKTILDEMENEVLVNVGEIARTMQTDFEFEAEGDEEEWDNYTNAAMDSLEGVYGFETKLTAALKQQNQ